MSEHQEQSALIQWAAMQEARYPELRLLFAIPNGSARDKVTNREFDKLVKCSYNAYSEGG